MDRPSGSSPVQAELAGSPTVENTKLTIPSLTPDTVAVEPNGVSGPNTAEPSIPKLKYAASRCTSSYSIVVVEFEPLILGPFVASVVANNDPSSKACTSVPAGGAPLPPGF